MNILSFLGLGNSKIKDALRKGAIVIDVRTPFEFDNGKAPDSINIPMDRIPINIERLKNMKRTIVICSNSVYESGVAEKKLKKAGIRDVLNGGTWIEVGKILQKL